jgi:hypothetical protein
MGLSSEPNKSTLCYANNHRDWSFFKEAFFLFLKEIQVELARRGIKMTPSFIDQTVILFDSTTIDLSVKLFDWALFRKAKGGAKVHTACDFNYIPCLAVVTPAKTHDVKVLEGIVDSMINERIQPDDAMAIVGEYADDLSGIVFEDIFPTGSILVFDRGYIKFSVFRKIQDLKLFFVTRAKINMNYKVVRELPLPKDITPADPRAAVVVKDEIISLVGSKSKDCPFELRLITAKDKETGKEYLFLTNLMDKPADVISALYKARWTIETFFKFLKQHSIVKSFVGTTENAVKTQIWASLISMMFVRYYQLVAGFMVNWCFSLIFDLIKTNLFCYISLEEMLENPTYRIRDPGLKFPPPSPKPASSLL